MSGAGSGAGAKRSYGDNRSGDGERRDKPRDWRDAYFDERDRDGGYRRDERDRRDDRDRDRRDYRDHDYDRRDRDRYNERDPRDRNGGLNYRERERERDGMGGRHDRRDDAQHGREEGEIDSPPPPPTRNARSPGESRPLSPRRADSRRGALSPRDDRRSMSGTSPVPPRGFQPLAIPVSVPPAVPERKRARVGFNVEDKPEPEPAPEAKPEPEEDEDLDKKREEKRRRREAIMAKFRAGEGAKPPLPAGLAPDGTQIDSGAQSVASNDPPTGVNTETGTTGTRSVTAAPTPIGNSPSLANTPLGKDFDLEKHGEASGTAPAPGDDVAAGDYDSAVDREKLKDKPSTKPADAEDEWQEVEIEVEDEADEMDMFAAFGDEPAEKKTRKITVRRRKNAAGEVIIEKPKSHKESVLEVVDNVDDVEGYYRITPGELLDDGRYQVTVTLGKGMFSAVVKAKVLKAVGQERRQDVVGKEVAIKLMRSQESMYVAGRKEAQVLKLLNDADPEDRKHIVRMERTFEHKGHFAIVTESMSMNLRDVIKRFGKDVGLNMRAVRAYAHQMLLALSLIRKCNIVHADIKPDNVLVSENKAVLKVCDLGTAAEVSEGEITPYLVSRFYRAPEIILGMQYDTAIDMWAIGCTLFELYTGKILFPGRSNNHMLLLMMELKGKPPNRMIKKAATFGAMHFDENNNFISVEQDRITGATVTKTMVISKATRDLRSRIMPSSSAQSRMKEDELKQLQQFVDLLEKCLMLDPVRRISPREALLHPFVAGN